jgi:long-chain acyl-CoA synthetase
MTPATTLNLASILERQAALRPDRPALVSGDRRFTWKQVDALASRVAHAIAGMGIEPGDHVALTCPNVPYFPIVYYGILKAGAVVVPLNVLFKPREVAYHLNDSDAKAYFCFEGTPQLPMAETGRDALASAPACARFVVMPRDPAAVEPFDGAPTLPALLHDQPDAFPAYATRPDDTSVILYTSGTTGQPKGAELTHANLVLNAMATRELALSLADTSLDGGDAALITLPLFHSFGQSAQMNAHVLAGHTIVLLPGFDAGAVIDTMERERVSFWAGVPTMFWGLLQHVAASGVDVRPAARRLKCALSGGAPMPVEVMRQFEETFGVRVLEGYGLSETSPVATFNHVERPSKPGTVGQPILGVEVACVDDRDRPVAPGVVGEVVIRGHNIMKGYYKRPDATAEAMRNGWFHTGDLGRFDEEGYLSIVDRTKDMIIRGGYNVYPREIEEVLMTHPDVSLCAVIGVPDEKLGEEVKAVVVPKPGSALTAEGLGQWARDQLAAYKYPRLVELRESLPMTATGKILKRALRA